MDNNDERCPGCGANLVMVGIRHRCVPRAAAVAPVVPKVAAPVERAPVPSAAEVTYRHRDPEKRRAYMRDYMRRKRAAAKVRWRLRHNTAKVG